VQARACECYEVIKEEYDRLYADLPGLPSSAISSSRE
jgi:hypothetical protein